jgi:hypothetical protein
MELEIIKLGMAFLSLLTGFHDDSCRSMKMLMIELGLALVQYNKMPPVLRSREASHFPKIRLIWALLIDAIRKSYWINSGNEREIEVGTPSRVIRKSSLRKSKSDRAGARLRDYYLRAISVLRINGYLMIL